MLKRIAHRGQETPKVLSLYFDGWDISCIDGKIEVLRADVYQDESIDFMGYLHTDEGRFLVEGTVTSDGKLYYTIK